MPTQITASVLDVLDDLAVASREDAALALRESGQTYRRIADQLGYNAPATACAAASRAAIRRDGTDDAIRVPGRRRVTRTLSPSSHLLARRFGIEVEFNRGTMRYGSDTSAVASALQRAGLFAEAESYNHSTRSHWKVTTDATVTGCEVVSPILRGAEWEQVTTTMRTITQVGGAVGTNCGMHVHHDATDFDADAIGVLIDNLQHVQHAMAAYVTKSRYNGRNSYAARLLTAYDWEMLRADHASGGLRAANQGRRAPAPGFRCSVSRYKFFNFQPLGMYGTIEFRGHGGTLNSQKARAWVAVGQAVMEYSRQGHRFGVTQSPRSMVDQLVEAGLLSERMATRYIRRVVALRGEAQADLAGRMLD